MKNLSLIAIFVALISLGCKPKSETVVTGADGSKATITNDGTTQHIEATDANGTKVSENISNSGVSISDNKGNSAQMNNAGVTEDVLGLPFYPGSEEAKAGGSSVIDSTDGKLVQCTRTTKDDPDQVASFYKDKISAASNSSNISGDTKRVILGGKLTSGAEVSIMATKKGAENTSILVNVSTKKKKA